MGILDSVRSARNAAAVIAEHPASSLAPDQKELYLRALALTAWADGTLAQAEHDYISMISNSLGLPPAGLEPMLSSSQSPDQSTVGQVLEAVSKFSCREAFLFDCVQVAEKSGVQSSDTSELIATFAELTGVTPVQAADMKKLSAMLTGTDLFGAQIYLEKKFGGVFEYVVKNLKVQLPPVQTRNGPFVSFGVRDGFETVVDTNAGLFLIHEPPRGTMEWGLGKMYVQKLAVQNTLSSGSWRLPEIGELQLLKDSGMLKDAFWSGTAGKDKDTYLYFDFSSGSQSVSSPLKKFRVCAIREL